MRLLDSYVIGWRRILHTTSLSLGSTILSTTDWLSRTHYLSRGFGAWQSGCFNVFLDAVIVVVDCTHRSPLVFTLQLSFPAELHSPRQPRSPRLQSSHQYQQLYNYPLNITAHHLQTSKSSKSEASHVPHTLQVTLRQLGVWGVGWTI